MTVQLTPVVAAGLTPVESRQALGIGSAQADLESAGTPQTLSAASSASAGSAGPAAAPAPHQAPVAEPFVGGALQVKVDPSTSQVVIQIIDGTTKEVIQKIPADDLIEIAQGQNQTQGFLINEKA